MTAEKYYLMCEQMGKTPDPDEIPPDENRDFPPDMKKAIDVFQRLGDRVQADIGYIGKDLSALHVYMDVYEVSNKKLFLETLLRLDAKLINKSQAEMKAQRDKIKRASKA